MIAVRAIDPALVDVTPRLNDYLNEIDPGYVDDSAARMARGGLAEPIRVVERHAGRFRLLAGPGRLAAALRLGRPTIEAEIVRENVLPTEVAVRKSTLWQMSKIESKFHQTACTEYQRVLLMCEWQDLYICGCPLA